MNQLNVLVVCTSCILIGCRSFQVLQQLYILSLCTHIRYLLFVPVSICMYQLYVLVVCSSSIYYMNVPVLNTSCMCQFMELVVRFCNTRNQVGTSCMYQVGTSFNYKLYELVECTSCMYQLYLLVAFINYMYLLLVV